ncbi:uncharacterized protein LOC117651413 [Thrips palmi]|uniref:Uncharacterized protein LOC117651413 n=1 Tax=Thrips palmi TaxID=161013 RepID=A0A6P9A248_THRPL|nr:uncharacterized protein LOC117651413 [Thrips palmi]
MNLSVRFSPNLTFGQKKECLKIISKIQQSKESFIFNPETNCESFEVFDISYFKSLNPQGLSLFLQEKCTDISAENIIYLLNEEVDGEAFLEFTEESLISNFPNLSFDQRTAIQNLFNYGGELQSEATFIKIKKPNSADVPVLEAEDDLGCYTLQA